MLLGESENAVALTARAALQTHLRVVGLRPVQPAAGLTTGGTVLSAAPTFQFDRCSTAKRMTEPLIGFALVSNSIYSRSILQCTKGSSLMEMQLEQQRQRAVLDSRDAISREAAALARRKAGPSAQPVDFDRLPRLLPPRRFHFFGLPGVTGGGRGGGGGGGGGGSCGGGVGGGGDDGASSLERSGLCLVSTMPASAGTGGDGAGGCEGWIRM